MKRSVGVTISAVVVLLGCLVMILMGGLSLVVPFLPSSSAPEPPLRVMLIGSSMLLGFAAWGILTAIGLFRLRPWARISMLVFSVFLVFATTVSAVAIFFMPIPAGQNISAQVMLATRIGIGGFYLCLGLIGVWWLYLFNKRTVKEQFRGIGGASARPLSITVIAWMLLLGAGACVLALASRGPAMICGLSLTGWKGALAFLCMGAAELYLGLALLKLKPLGRILAICFLVFGIVNCLLCVALPGSEARFVAAVDSFSPEMRHQSLSYLSPWVLWLTVVVCAIVMAIQLWFLITRKAAFSGGAMRAENQEQ